MRECDLLLDFLLIFLFGVSLLWSSGLCAKTLMASLDSDSFGWAEDEFISGGQIVVHCGSIAVLNSSGALLNWAPSYDPKTRTGRVELFYYQASGGFPNKQTDLNMAFMRNWLELKTSDNCDAHSDATIRPCGAVQIEGYLTLSAVQVNGFVKRRKVPLSTTNFVFREILPH